MLSENQVVGDKYRVVRLIGEGGMGTVYEAVHLLLGKRVALKFLRTELAQRTHLKARFIQEAQVSSTIRNAHIVAVSDVEDGPDGVFIVMDLLRGESLRETLQRDGRIPPGRAVGWMLQVLRGIEAAHALGVVHRDLKPGNIFLCSEENRDETKLVKILDFGIAKLRHSREYQVMLTRPGSVMGTPEYMAPEQAFSADLVDQRSDVYSLGVLLFEMLSGVVPVEGESPQQVAEKILKGERRRLPELCPSLPPGLVAVVARAIEPKPEERFADVGQLRVRLLQYATDEVATTVPPSNSGPPVASSLPVSEWGPPTAPQTPLAAVALDSALVQAQSSAEPASPIPPAEERSVPRLGEGRAGGAATMAMSPTDVSARDERRLPATDPEPPRRPPPPAQRHPLRPVAWLLAVTVMLAAGLGGWWWWEDYNYIEPPPQPVRVQFAAPASSRAQPEPVAADQEPEEDAPSLKAQRRSPSRPVKGSAAPKAQLPFPIPTALPNIIAIPTSLPKVIPTSWQGLPFPTVLSLPVDDAPSVGSSRVPL